MEHTGHESPTCARDNSLAEAGHAFIAETLKTQKHIFLTSPPGVGKTTMIRRLLGRIRKEAGEVAANITGFYTEEVRDPKGQRIGFDVVCIGAKQGGQHARCSLARLGQDPPRIGKYTVNVAAFEEFAVPVLELAVPLPSHPGLSSASDGMQEVISHQREERGDICRKQTATENQEANLDEAPQEVVRDSWTTTPMRCASSKSRLCVCDEVGKMALLSSKFPSILHAALDGGAVVLGTLPQPAKGQRDHELVEHVKKRADVRVFRVTRGNRDAMVESVYEMLQKSLAVDGARRISPMVQIIEQNGDTTNVTHRSELACMHIAASNVLSPEEDQSGRAGLEIATTVQSAPKVSMVCGPPRIDPQEASAVATTAAAGAAEAAVKLTKLKDREAKAKEQARNREMAAKRAREGRKLRAEARKKARELAKSGVAVGVEDGPDMEVFEDDEENLGRNGDADVEALDVVLDVDKPLGMVCRTASRESQQPPRKFARASSRGSIVPPGQPPPAENCVLLDDG